MPAKTPERTLIIGDLHLCPMDSVEEFITRRAPDHVIFLGDYFDCLGDSPLRVGQMARWLRRSMMQPNRVHLLGNHDLPYLYPEKIQWPGYSADKADAVAANMDLPAWRGQARLYHYLVHENLLCSHAGLSRPLLPSKDMQPKDMLVWLETESATALRLIEAAPAFDPIQSLLPLLEAGQARAGPNYCGGLLWCDFDREFEAIPGINQVFGHTPHSDVRNLPGPNSPMNYCIDTSSPSGKRAPRKCLLISGSGAEVLSLAKGSG